VVPKTLESVDELEKKFSGVWAERIRLAYVHRSNHNVSLYVVLLVCVSSDTSDTFTTKDVI
jgi:hypothetical protein